MSDAHCCAVLWCAVDSLSCAQSDRASASNPSVLSPAALSLSVFSGQPLLSALRSCNASLLASILPKPQPNTTSHFEWPPLPPAPAPLDSDVSASDVLRQAEVYCALDGSTLCVKFDAPSSDAVVVPTAGRGGAGSSESKRVDPLTLSRAMVERDAYVPSLLLLCFFTSNLIEPFHSLPLSLFA